MTHLEFSGLILALMTIIIISCLLISIYVQQKAIKLHTYHFEYQWKD
jgi:hypothetical protein